MFNIKSGYIKLKVIYLCRGKKNTNVWRDWNLQGLLIFKNVAFLFQALCTKQLFYGPSLM